MGSKNFSVEHCRLVVKKYLDLEEFEILKYEETHNFDSYFEVNIQVYVNNSEQELKFVGKVFENRQDFVKEVYLYNFFFNEFKNECLKTDLSFMPEIYFVNDSCIIFDDFFANGFIFPQSLNVKEIKMILSELAKFHAVSFDFQQSNKLCSFINKQNEFSEKDESLKTAWFKNKLDLLCCLIDCFPENALPCENLKEDLHRTYESAIKISKSANNFRNVLCHGFMWGKSAMFKYDGNKNASECKLINFNLIQYSPPAFDVLQLIYAASTAESRKHYLHELLEYYYNRLSNELQKRDLDARKVIPFEEDFEVSVHCLLPIIKFQTACYRLTLPEGSNGEFQNIMKLFESDERFRKSIMDSIKDLKDLISHVGLTNEDCFKIVKNKIGTANYELIDYALIPLGKICGYLGDHNKLKINILVDGKRQTLNMFAKLMPTNNAALSILADVDGFCKEIYIYQYYVQMLTRRGVNIIEECVIPCYFTRHNNVLIFDDFEIMNFKTLDPRRAYSYEIAKIVLKKLAKFHACSIILEEKISEETGKKYRLTDEYEKELQEKFYLHAKNHQGARCVEAGIEAVEHEIDLFSDPRDASLNEDVKHKMKKAYQECYNLVKPSLEFRNVVCHGDLWISNIMIQHSNGNPIDCRFIDYQICRYCPPAHDLLCFIFLTTSRNIRSQHFDEFINLYYEEFSKNLTDHGVDIEKVYPYDHFMRSVEYLIPQAVCQTVIYFQLTLTNSDIVKEYLTTEESCYNIMLGDRREIITDMAKRDSLYRERASESIQDLREVCLKYY